jgi:metal-responsive CopG/Arc/MetJ family transcriptional regulator
MLTQLKKLSSYDKFNKICSVLNSSSLKANKRMTGNTHSSGAVFTVLYNHKTSQYVIDTVLKLQHQFQEFGNVQKIDIQDTLNYFEQQERLIRKSQSIIGCSSFVDVQQLTPVTHGAIVIEVHFI